MHYRNFVASSFLGRLFRFTLLIIFAHYLLDAETRLETFLILLAGVGLFLAMTFGAYILWRRMGIRENTIIDRSIDWFNELFRGLQVRMKRRSRFYKDMLENEKWRELRNERKEHQINSDHKREEDG